MISDKNKLIQVKVSKLSYELLKKYSKLLNVSMSKFCEIAINNKINSIDENGGYIYIYGNKKKF